EDLHGAHLRARAADLDVLDQRRERRVEGTQRETPARRVPGHRRRVRLGERAQVAGEGGADAVDEYRDRRILGQAQRLAFAPALDGGDVAFDHDALGARGGGALLEPRRRREDELARGFHRLVEQREDLLLLECGAPRLVARKRLEELLHAIGVRGRRQYQGRGDERAAQPHALAPQKSWKL